MRSLFFEATPPFRRTSSTHFQEYSGTLMKILKNVQKKSKRIPKVSDSSAASHLYYFGCFCVNEAEQQLLRHGKPIRLSPKAFDVLLVLIQNKGSLVSKDKFLAEVWPDAFVEDANLSVNIANLRKVLDEGDAKRQCIETVPKRGYRFVARVSAVVQNGHEKPEAARLVEEQTDGERNEVLNSVAVLPFVNEGCGSAGDYLSAGLMESISNSLSRSRELRVMAPHTVYSRHLYDLDPRTVGHELGVRSVLVGRILPLDDRLIVRTELVDVINGWQLWGEQYQTKISDVLITQQELTAEIAERLRIELAGFTDLS